MYMNLSKKAFKLIEFFFTNLGNYQSSCMCKLRFSAKACSLKQCLFVSDLQSIFLIRCSSITFFQHRFKDFVLDEKSSFSIIPVSTQDRLG